jgi:hypothetical protein
MARSDRPLLQGLSGKPRVTVAERHDSKASHTCGASHGAWRVACEALVVIYNDGVVHDSKASYVEWSVAYLERHLLGASPTLGSVTYSSEGKQLTYVQEACVAVAVDEPPTWSVTHTLGASPTYLERHLLGASPTWIVTYLERHLLGVSPMCQRCLPGASLRHDGELTRRMCRKRA